MQEMFCICGTFPVFRFYSEPAGVLVEKLKVGCNYSVFQGKVTK